MTSIGIINYGMANLRSVQKALEKVGFSATITSSPPDIPLFDKIILPGVGAFRDAIARLKSEGLAGPIRRHIDEGKPFLGICLGLQLLFTTSYEDGEHPGLDVLKGAVVRFTEKPGLKIPHMGWNQIQKQAEIPLLSTVSDGSSVYFVHSYYVEPEDKTLIATTTDYPQPFVSSVWKENLFATQFHPEKSQKTGLAILRAFAEWGSTESGPEKKEVEASL